MKRFIVRFPERTIHRQRPARNHFDHKRDQFRSEWHIDVICRKKKLRIIHHTVKVKLSTNNSNSLLFCLSRNRFLSSESTLLDILSLQILITAPLHAPHLVQSQLLTHNILQATPLPQRFQGMHILQEVTQPFLCTGPRFFHQTTVSLVSSLPRHFSELLDLQCGLFALLFSLRMLVCFLIHVKRVQSIILFERF